MKTLVSRFITWLRNEPIVKQLGPVGVAQAIVALLLGLGYLTPGQATALSAFLAVFVTPIAISHARDATIGPVTAKQMIELPGTDAADLTKDA